MQMIDPAAIQTDSAYRLLAELEHQNLAPFINRYYWRQRSWITYLHYALSLACIGGWVILGLRTGLSGDGWLSSFGWAVLAFVVLVPIHEAIHGVIYKLLGANDVRFGGSWRRLYAYATAHLFVVRADRFVWVALGPFVIINGLLLLLMVVLPDLRVWLAAVLLFHTAGTSGDWALINYLWLERGHEVYTFDDVVAQKTFFYARET